MIKLVAFDWNGTLFADTHSVHKSNAEVFKLLGFKPLSFNDFQKYFDVPVRKLYLAGGIPEEIMDKNAAKIAQIFHSNYEPKADKIRTRAYTKYLLEYLSKNYTKSIIFSNHILEPIKRQLKRLNLEKYFSEVLANSHIETSLKTRGKKENLKKYLKENHILSSETLIVGDTIEEVEIGKELGCKTIAITQGNCSTVRLKAAKPDYLIHSLKDVIKIIQKSEKFL